MLNSRFIDTHGTAPQFGIDIEPNTHLLPVMDVKISGCYFSNNLGGSILVTDAQKIIISSSTFKGGKCFIKIGDTVKNVQITNNHIDEGGIITTSGSNVSVTDTHLMKVKLGS